MAKTTTISVGSNGYDLHPARSRTHYHDPSRGGGTPYAYPIKGGKGVDAWLVASRINGRILGCLEKIDSNKYSFMKTEKDGQAIPIPPGMKDETYGASSSIYYELSVRVHSGTTRAEAIANGLGLGRRR